jgi:hypothetical protein
VGGSPPHARIAGSHKSKIALVPHTLKPRIVREWPKKGAKHTFSARVIDDQHSFSGVMRKHALKTSLGFGKRVKNRDYHPH